MVGAKFRYGKPSRASAPSWTFSSSTIFTRNLKAVGTREGLPSVAGCVAPNHDVVWAVSPAP